LITDSKDKAETSNAIDEPIKRRQGRNKIKNGISVVYLRNPMSYFHVYE
jgi:hypothetical protein